MSQFETMTLDELLFAEKEIQSLIKKRRAEAKDELLAEFTQKAEKLGIDIKDLVGAKKTKAPVRFRNPDNKTQSWSGRGNQPKWLKEKLETGAKLEDFKI